MTAPTHGAVLDAESAAAWLELSERDDRTSPEDYPEMCLIEREELAEFMARAYRLARPTPEGEWRSHDPRYGGGYRPCGPDQWVEVADSKKENRRVDLAGSVFWGAGSDCESPVWYWRPTTPPAQPEPGAGELQIVGHAGAERLVTLSSAQAKIARLEEAYASAMDQVTEVRARLAEMKSRALSAETCRDAYRDQSLANEERADNAEAAKVRELDRLAFQLAWEGFLNANPDDLTSPDDLPDHALVTADQAFEIARQALAAQTERGA